MAETHEKVICARASLRAKEKQENATFERTEGARKKCCKQKTSPHTHRASAKLDRPV